MNLVGKLIRYFKDEDFRIHVKTKLGLYRNMPDDEYIRMIFKADMGYEIDLNNPKTFNEKLQWIKLYDRNPQYTIMVDKYLSKEFVASKVGSEYVIPLIGVWEKAEDIDFETLPNTFVMKCNHNSGNVVVCKDKSKLDYEKTRAKMAKALKDDFFSYSKEWPYKNVPKRIIAEEFIEDVPGKIPFDYKFMCFNGEPKLMYIHGGRDDEDGQWEAFFDMDGKPMDIVMDTPKSKVERTLPPCFEKMKELARVLSSGIPFVRVDFYYCKGHIYVGELTFFHDGGFAPMEPKELDRTLGDWITLPEKNK